MLINQINDCKIKLNQEESRLKELEEELKKCEEHTDKIRYPILYGIVTSFILNTFGYIIMNPFVVLGSLLMLAGMIPCYCIFFKREGRSAKVEDKIKECKENITKYENELERLNSNREVNDLINYYTSIPQVKMEIAPIRLNKQNKRNNRLR